MVEIALRVRNLVKDFDIYERPIDLAVEMLTRKKRHTTFRALDGISFEVPKGGVLGIIGSNGAGKSTLLKIITGVLDATSGSVEISGRVTAILELGLGFNPEYSGHENIFLSGLLYGMDRAEVERKISSIIEFSGLQEFIDRPVKTYSSGMQSRLAFSIATAAEPEILIIDEALSTGDAMFVQKCMSRIHDLCKGGRTVLLVSHGTGMLTQLCDHVIWLDKGKIKQIGGALEVVQSYDLAAHQGANSNSWIEYSEASFEASAPPTHLFSDELESITALKKNVPLYRLGPILIDRVDLLDKNHLPTSRLTTLEPFKIRIRYRCEGPLPGDSLGVAIAINRKHDLWPAAQWFTQNRLPGEVWDDYESASYRVKPAKSGEIEIDYRYLTLSAGEYLMSIGLMPNRPGVWQFYEYRHLFYEFSITDAGMEIGAPVFLLPEKIKHTPHKDVEQDAEGVRPKETKPSYLTLGDEVKDICIKEGGYPFAWNRHTSCPACGETLLLDAFKKKNFAHRRCAVCNFTFVDPYPPEDIVEKLYKGVFYTNTREYYESWRITSGQSATIYSAPEDILQEIISTAAPPNTSGRWLEVGGGIGEFANLIAKERSTWTVQLNEHNSRSIDLAQSLFKLEVVAEDAEALFHAGECYDVISSIAVLEHVTHPLEFIKSYVRLLKPGGMLVTLVPNFSPLNLAVSHGAYANVEPPFHVSLFNAQNLDLMLRRSGDFQSVIVKEAGPPAFSLVEHVDFGGHYDVSIPSAAQRESQSVQKRAFTEAETKALNVLTIAQREMGDYFAETDGRLFLIAYARKRI